MHGRMLQKQKQDVPIVDTNEPTFSRFRSGLQMSLRQRITSAASVISSGTRMSDKMRVYPFILSKY